MVLLALDASSQVTGFSILESNEKDLDNPILVASGEIHLNKFKTKKFPLEYIKVLYEEITKIILAYSPDTVIIEDIFAINVKTHKSLARIRGVCEVACLNNGIKNIYSVNASSARKTVLGEGKGGMKSDEICVILENKFGKILKTVGYDLSDSILIGLCGIKLYANKTNTGNDIGRIRRIKQSNDSSKKRK